MRRWSKEPRRISVVEGRAPASLVRALRRASCFIYKNETIERRFCQSLSEHLFHFLFFLRRSRLSPKSRRSVSHILGPACASERREKSAPSSESRGRPGSEAQHPRASLRFSQTTAS